MDRVTPIDAYEDKNTRFWRDEIAASKGVSSKLWRTSKGDAPPADSNVHTADDFATFFNDKIDAVRASTAATTLYDVPHRTTTTMMEWRDVTSDEVGKLINAAPNKTRQSDPAPTWLVEDMRGLLAPFLSMLFNKSLTTGCFPSQSKEAVVRPILKKTGLDASERKNYRPMSELTICLQTAGEGRSSSYPGLLRRQRIDAEDAVCVSTVPQHRNSGNEGVQRLAVSSGRR